MNFILKLSFHYMAHGPLGTEACVRPKLGYDISFLERRDAERRTEFLSKEHPVISVYSKHERVPIMKLFNSIGKKRI